jgi:NAD(P)H-nitrite reductase large subunit
MKNKTTFFLANYGFQVQVLVVLLFIRTIEKRIMKGYLAKKCGGSAIRKKLSRILLVLLRKEPHNFFLQPKPELYRKHDTDQARTKNLLYNIKHLLDKIKQVILFEEKIFLSKYWRYGQRKKWQKNFWHFKNFPPIINCNNCF